VVDLFIDNRIHDLHVFACDSFQHALYVRLLENVAEHRHIALKVLTAPFPESKTDGTFSELFMKFTELELDTTEVDVLLENFNVILSRVDNRLVTYDFLYQSLARGCILALPFLVSVSVTQAVDVSEVYEFTFRALSLASLRRGSRVRVLETLSKILASSKLPSSVTTAFAVKLSRFLPRIPLDAQLDVLGLLQVLVRAHGAVAQLLTITAAPVADVDHGIAECAPQTLWEAKAMQHSPVPAIADTARKLGMCHMAPDLGSFNLRAVIGTCKTKPVKSSASGDWINGLDRDGWTFPSVPVRSRS
jgi:hypothetical protein